MQVHKVNQSNRVGKELEAELLMWKTMVFAVSPKHHGAEEIVDDANFYRRCLERASYKFINV